MELSWEAWFTLGLLPVLFGLLVCTRISADVVFLGGLTLLLATSILEPGEALKGLANEGMVTVGVLFVVVAGLRETGAVTWLVDRLLGRPQSVLGAQVRIMAPVSVLSALLNNTPVVAMMIPGITDWARKRGLSVSKLLLPLSYAAILGGTCTLIGTSTNLVVNGLYKSEYPELSGLGMFEITKVALPCAVLGMTYLLLFSRWLIPDRRPAISTTDDPREYTVEMLVEPNSGLVGQTIEQAGLRHLSGMYLAEIDRSGRILPAVGPQERLEAGDRLVFVGVVESVVDLQRIRGLTPATDQVFKLDAPRSERCLIEAVVSDSCPLIGMTIRDGQFRSVYNAAVIAVARNAQRIQKKIGDIMLQSGDTLLLEANPAFATQQRNSRDFFLVSRIENSRPPRHDRAVIAWGILLAMVGVVTLQLVSLMTAAMVAAGLMVLTRCCRATEARANVDWSVLLVIAATFGIGEALKKTGAAGAMATHLVDLAGEDPWLTLAAIYFVTMLFTEMITNNAAAVLVFPIAIAAAAELDVNVMPFIITIMMAASASFSTPIGYQTNLMVYGPGGYRFVDYLRVGIPLNLLMWITTVLLVPRIWSF